MLIWKDIRKPEMLDKLLQLLAHQIGCEVSTNELATQLGIKSNTVESYIDLLEKAYVVFRLRSYSQNPRKELSKSQKIYFWDNGIRNAVISNFLPLESRSDIGALFENLVISERMKFLQHHQKKIGSYFWRSYNQQEVDLVEKTSTEIKAVEVKYNTKKKHRVTRGFTNNYPEAKTFVITPENLKWVYQ